ncbi:outer membrane efflux protein [Ruminiclostridium sufflavum DSM 19573]|uniref:Outer membrane efflux protein n=1 Tax=Ruminiclostridium sufflavum DSM 19573 TaxID=1121337 RepID=A0A318XWI6_9FIRM|nr:TolC family protein [Ruminiclostridium sufflavum]PYG87157.1 outer membrane efflux protein [Ruminiclostridium sufflavum DSM 19573]
MLRRKLAVMLLISAVAANLFNPVFADVQEEKAEPVVLSLELAQEKAVQNENSIIQTNRSIQNLIKGNKYNASKDDFFNSDAIKAIDDLYTRLKNGSSMDSTEFAKLYVLYTMYGDTSYFIGKEDITKYMNPGKFPHYSMWANVMKLSLGNRMTETGLKDKTGQLYDNILSARGKFDILNTTVEFQEKTYKQQKIRYNLGELSKASIEEAYKQLQIKKLEARKLSRTIDNLEIDLKRLTGLPISSNLVLKDYSKDTIEVFEPYDTYLNSALINRNEILMAKIDYWVAKNDFNIANEAFSNNPWNVKAILNKSLTEQKINEAELSISAGKEAVLQSINYSYIDVKYKKEKMDTCKEDLNFANEQYKIAVEKYEKQLITETEKTSEEINSLSALSAYNDSVRIYNSAVRNLRQVSKLGIGLQY